MKTSRPLVKTVSSLSAASLLALVPQHVEADIPKTQPTIEPPPDDHQARNAEPILLTPNSIETQLFAGHSSHSSHASHASHYSGSGGGGDYTTPDAPATTTPSYVPPAYNPPAYTPPQNPSTPYTPGSSSSATSNLVQIEFTNGATLIGTVLSMSSEGIIFAATTGKNYNIPRTLLSQKTIDALHLPAK